MTMRSLATMLLSLVLYVSPVMAQVIHVPGPGGGSGSSASPANPSATTGLSAVNGIASTWMRSDSAPPLSQAITPTWTGLHTFNAGLKGELRDKGGQVFNVKAYGAVADGVTDDSTAVLLTIAEADSASGGIIYFPAGTYVINSQIVFPNSGASPPTQKSFRLMGAGPSPRGTGSVGPTGGTILLLGYAGTVAKIDTRGAGYLEIDHLTLQEPSAVTTLPFIQTTNTTLHIHDTEFFGHSTKSGTACDQDAIILGGTSAGAADGTSTSPFQGYGTVITANYFDRIRRMAYLKVYSNGNVITGNTVWGHSGSNLVGGAAIEILGDTGSGTDGNYIAGNLIEMLGYPYGVKVANGLQNSFIGNNFYDPSGTSLAYYRFETTGVYNFILDGFRDDSKALVSDASSPSTQTVFTSHQNQPTVIPQSLTLRDTTNKIAGTTNVGGWILEDSAGNRMDTQTSTSSSKLTWRYTASGGGAQDLMTVWRASATDTRLLMNGSTNAVIQAPDTQLKLESGDGHELWLGDSANLKYYIVNGLMNATATNADAFKMANTGGIGWSGTGAPSGGSDTGLTRNAAGVVEVNNGTLNTLRDLKLRNLNANNHIESSGAAPAVTSCGGSPGIVGTDVAGKVTIGSAPGTSCVLTFAVAYTNAPACVTSDETTAILTRATSTTTTVTLSGVFIAGDVVAYQCIGRL